jgi:hypothetical protein
MMAHQWGDDVVEGGGWVLAISRLSFKACYGVVKEWSDGAMGNKCSLQHDSISPLTVGFSFLLSPILWSVW